MHEEPQVPNYRCSGQRTRLEAGMTLAIEPMVNQGTHMVKFYETDDGRNSRRKLSAHYENTIAITEDEPIILTMLA